MKINVVVKQCLLIILCVWMQDLKAQSDPVVAKKIAHALEANDRSAVEKLVGWGIDAPFIGQDKNLFALQFAVTHNLHLVVDELINRKIDINKKDESGKTALHYAARYTNRYHTLKQLIENGAAINVLDNDGNTPLYETLLYGSFATDPTDYNERYQKAKLLIQHGASVNSEGTALPLIFYSVGHYDMLKLLVEAGANVNAKNNFNHLMGRGGDTPLHWASQYGTLNEIHYLLEQGAEMNAVDDCGWTPLHCAIFSGNTDLVKFYLSQGVDSTLRTKKEFEVLWGGMAENPYPQGATLLQVATVAQSNAARHDKQSSDYDEIISILE